MKSLTEEWLKAARDDLDVIERIIDDAHLAHIVAFHAQQCIEKGLKAILEEHGIEAPKIHNLVTLSGKVETFIREKFDMVMFKTLDSLYIDARYPGELGLLPNGKPTAEDAKKFYAFAIMVFETLRCYLKDI
jgi:HEPN domain-containing protein